LRDRSYAFGRRGRLNQLKLSLIGARSTATPRKKYRSFSFSHEQHFQQARADTAA
jgi:hypothetical protein